MTLTRKSWLMRTLRNGWEGVKRLASSPFAQHALAGSIEAGKEYLLGKLPGATLSPILDEDPTVGNPTWGYLQSPPHPTWNNVRKEVAKETREVTAKPQKDYKHLDSEDFRILSAYDYFKNARRETEGANKIINQKHEKYKARKKARDLKLKKALKDKFNQELINKGKRKYAKKNLIKKYTPSKPQQPSTISAVEKAKLEGKIKQLKKKDEKRFRKYREEYGLLNVPKVKYPTHVSKLETKPKKKIEYISSM